MGAAPVVVNAPDGLALQRPGGYTGPVKRVILILCGLVFVGLAGLGIALPGLPATPFLLLAVACFARSSPRLHSWLVERSVFAPLIRNWQESRSIPRRAKIIAFVMVGVAGLMIAVTIPHLYVKAGLILLLGFPIFFISRLPVTESLRTAD